MSYMLLSGKLPDFSPLQTSLKVLDLSYNVFTGQFPMSVFNLSSLEFLNFNEMKASTSGSFQRMFPTLKSQDFGAHNKHGARSNSSIFREPYFPC